jgi:hypothetical protein
MSLPLLVAPDVEAYLTAYLRFSLSTAGLSYTSGVTVSISVPDPIPARLVVVRRDGGSRLDDVREAARLGIRVWASTDKDAHDLAAYVAGLVVASPDGQPVLRARLLSGPSSIAEPNPQRRLRYLTAEVIVRCAPPA